MAGHMLPTTWRRRECNEYRRACFVGNSSFRFLDTSESQESNEKVRKSVSVMHQMHQLVVWKSPLSIAMAVICTTHFASIAHPC